MNPLSSLFQSSSVSAEPEHDELDLVQQLRGPDGPELMRQMSQRLEALQSELTLQIHQGAQASTYEQLQAALASVKAGRDILSRLPVTFKNIPDHPMANRPAQS
ncbi:MAG: hypothetical protein WCK08_17145 [Betaproteobacteria bacterium]